MRMEQYFDRPDSCYFVPDRSGPHLTAGETGKKEVKHILRIADEVCENTFLFDLDWDMERTCEPVTFREDVDWCCIPDEDPEFVWQFNRHRFFICLGQAWQLTGDEKYVRNFLRLIHDWMDQFPWKESCRWGPGGCWKQD